MRQLLIAEQHVAVQRGFQFLAGLEAVGLKLVLDPAVEALDHAVGFRMPLQGRRVFDAEVGAELIERVLAAGGALAQAEQAVGADNCLTHAQAKSAPLDAVGVSWQHR